MQEPKIKILVVDDEEFWRNHLARVLRRNNFTVDVADSLTTAKELLGTRRYHLVVTDIMLVEEQPVGMDLLKHLESEIERRVIRVIAISGTSDKKIVRATFQQRVSEFLFKGDYSGDDGASRLETEMIEAVNNALSDFQSAVELTLDDNTLHMLVGMIRIGNRQVKPESDLFPELKEELIELLRKLYPQALQLNIRVFGTTGNSGTGIALVQPVFEEGAAALALLKYGEREKIHAEHTNYAQYSSFIAAQYRPELERYAETHRLGGIIYSFITRGESKAQELLEYYREGTIEHVTDCINQFFRQVCDSWYTNPPRWDAVNIAALYRDYGKLTKENLSKALKDKLPEYFEVYQIKDSLFTQSIVNPVYVDFDYPIVRQAAFRITHGDLNMRNILVGEASKPWLIDFLSVGYGHCLRDFIALEVSVKFDALDQTHATLQERMALESIFLRADNYSACHTLQFDTKNDVIKKCFLTVKYIRRHAEAVAFPDQSLFQYHVGLFFSTLNVLRFYDLSKIQRTHALFSAALLAQKIGLASIG